MKSFKEIKNDLKYGWYKTEDKLKEVGKVAWENKEFILAAGTLLVAGVHQGVKIYDRAHDRSEKRRISKEIYDPTLHRNIKLKTRLSNGQIREINDRYANGEKLHDIYKDMNLLK